ncbi:hypothetical protein JCM6882_004329 [Rhodosporidiobolus microsporus]
MSDTSTDPAAAAAAAQAAVHAAVDGVLVPVQLVGTFISCLPFGLFLSLAARYYGRFPHDRPQFRILVGVLCVLCTADTCTDCAWAYRYAVQSFLQPANLAEWPTCFTIFGFITGTSIFICQAFFIWRGWVVAGRDRYLFAAVQLIIATGTAVCIFFVSGKSVSWSLMEDFTPLKPVIYAWISGGLAVDLLITGYLVYSLLVRPKKGSLSAVSSPLKRLAILAVKTNFASLIVQLAVLILIVSRPTFHYAIAGFNETKTYAICVVATLNARSDSQSGTSYGATSGEQPGRVKGLGATNPFSNNNGQPSLQIHRSRHVDEESQYQQQQDEALAPYALFVLDNGTTAATTKGATSEKGMGSVRSL